MFRQHLGQVAWFQPAKGGSAPAPPDPYATSQAQTQSNQQTAAYNAALDRGSVFTPLGSQTYQQNRTDPNTGAPIWDQTISLNPDIQRLFDQQNQQNLALGNTAQNMLNQVDVAYNRPISTETLPQLQNGSSQQGPALQGQIDTSGVPQLQSDLDFSGLPQLYGANDLLGARQQSQDAVYNRQKAYLDPQWSQRETDLTTALANKGVVEGSEAWTKARDQFGRERNFDYSDARNAAIMGGGDELSRLVNIAQGNRGQMANERIAGGNFRNNANAQGFGQAAQAGAFQNAARGQGTSEALARANMANNARSQGLQELLALRNQPLNEFNALRSASPVNMPQFTGPGDTNMQGTDVAGNIWNAYQGNLAQWQQKQQNNNALLSGLFGLGSAWLGGK